MSDGNIEKMDLKELRKEVRLLSDELAIFKRKYEDMIYNLDTDNFGKSFTVAQNNMKAQIKVSADAIKTKVSKDELDGELKNYSTITQTADSIQTAVNQMNGELENYSTITQTANAIQSVVSKGANLDSAIPIESIEYATDVNAVYVVRSTDAQGNITGEKYYYYNDLLHQWEILSGDSIYTVFNQTASGFELKGNVLIDGNTVITKDLTLSGNVTWDMSNSPVWSQYSADQLNWHDGMETNDIYMRMTFDGGNSWSNPTKVVGTDGKDGTNGSNSNITAQQIFNLLTDNGENQGLFSAFVNNENQLYINAEYLYTRLATVADILYIGDESSTGKKKKITFNTKINISTDSDGVGNYALAFNCSELHFPIKPSKIKVNNPTASAMSYITLEKYVNDCVKSGIESDVPGMITEKLNDFKVTAVFG